MVPRAAQGLQQHFELLVLFPSHHRRLSRRALGGYSSFSPPSPETVAQLPQNTWVTTMFQMQLTCLLAKSIGCHCSAAHTHLVPAVGRRSPPGACLKKRGGILPSLWHVCCRRDLGVLVSIDLAAHQAHAHKVLAEEAKGSLHWPL